MKKNQIKRLAVLTIIAYLTTVGFSVERYNFSAFDQVNIFAECENKPSAQDDTQKKERKMMGKGATCQEEESKTNKANSVIGETSEPKKTSKNNSKSNLSNIKNLTEEKLPQSGSFMSIFKKLINLIRDLIKNIFHLIMPSMKTQETQTTIALPEPEKKQKVSIENDATEVAEDEEVKQVDETEVKQVDATEVDATEVDATEVKQVDATEVDATEVKEPESSTTQISDENNSPILTQIYGNSTNKLKLVVIQEGYSDMNLFRDDVYKFVIDGVFSKPEWKEYKQYLNLYILKLKDYDWGLIAGGDFSDRTYPGTVVKKYLPDVSSVLLLSVKNEGWGVAHFPEIPVCCVSVNQEVILTIGHELGHTIGKLPDQYPTGSEISKGAEYAQRYPCFMNDMRTFDTLCGECKPKFVNEMAQYITSN